MEEKSWLDMDTVGGISLLLLGKEDVADVLTLVASLDLKFCKGAPELEDPTGDPYKAARNGYEFFKLLQSGDGHWAGEYGGPLFLVSLSKERQAGQTCQGEKVVDASQTFVPLFNHVSDSRYDHHFIRNAGARARRVEDRDCSLPRQHAARWRQSGLRMGPVRSTSSPDKYSDSPKDIS